MMDDLKRIAPRRKSIRLPEYDYALPGSYFITVCTRGREYLFGEISNGVMRENHLGTIVRTCWKELPDHYDNILLDEFVIMANHIHGIIIIIGDVIVHRVVGDGLRPSPTPFPTNVKHKRHGLPEIVRAFKSFSARRINKFRKTSSQSIWQRNYFEHIIRNEKSLNRIREYIVTNPERWELDNENPDCRSVDEFNLWLKLEGKEPLLKKL